jgi:diguanylate cyclase (GGDEF)-like protein
VLARQAEIGSRTGHPGDIRVALLSYFLDVDRQLERPKVVEMTWVERTAASALLDDATGLPNQRFFRAQLGREIERSLQHNSPLSLLVLDIDDFKRVNDLLGHDTGTATLRALATLLRAHARPSDLVVRYGGDEFVVLLPATPKPDAARVAETFRTAMKSQWGQPGDGSAPLAVTVSVGVATCPGDARSGTELFVAADRALYDAKIAGKDCVRLCGESARSYARRKAVWPARVDPAGAPGYPVETLEVSEGGFSFRSEHDLPIGAVFEATLTTPDGRTLRIVGRVVRSRAEAPMRYEIAARFLEPGGSDREHLARWVCSA